LPLEKTAGVGQWGEAEHRAAQRQFNALASSEHHKPEGFFPFFLRKKSRFSVRE
jgi:hypothetical protein